MERMIGLVHINQYRWWRVVHMNHPISDKRNLIHLLDVQFFDSVTEGISGDV